MTKTTRRWLARELAELERRGKRILSGGELPWGVPWCAGAGSPGHQPPCCAGCAGRLWCTDLAAQLVPRVIELRQLLAPPPVQDALW